MTTLRLNVLGNASSAIRALNQVGQRSQGLSRQVAGAFSGAAVRSITNFVGSSSKAFQDLSGQVKTLQRYTGGSAEEASRLAHVMALTGQDTEGITKAMGKFNKGGAKALEGIGIASKDAEGHTRTFLDVLPEVADKFKAMKNPADKTKLAMELFGKQGASLIPMLNKGGDELKSMAKEADKLGLTLSKKDLQATTDATVAKRKFSEALKGVQVMIGKYVYPILTKLTILFQSKVVPIIAKATDWMGKHKTIVKAVAIAVASLMAAFKAYQIISKVVRAVAALNAVLLANPVVAIIAALVALGAALVVLYKKNEKFREIVQNVWKKVRGAFDAAWRFIKPILETLGRALRTTGDGLKWAWEHVIKPTWELVKGGIKVAWTVVKTYVTFLITFWKTVGNGLKAAWDNVIKPTYEAIKTGIATVKNVILSVVGGIGRIWDNFKTMTGKALGWIIDKFLGFASTLVGLADKAFGWIPGIGPKLGDAKKAIEEFRVKVKTEFGLIPSNKSITVSTPGADAAINNLRTIETILGNIISKAPIAANKTKQGGLGELLPTARARGGPVVRNRPYIVGERRAELFVPNSNGYIRPSVPTGAGGGITVYLMGTFLNGDQAGRELAGHLEKYAGRGGTMKISKALR